MYGSSLNKNPFIYCTFLFLTDVLYLVHVRTSPSFPVIVQIMLKVQRCNFQAWLLVSKFEWSMSMSSFGQSAIVSALPIHIEGERFNSSSVYNLNTKFMISATQQASSQFTSNPHSPCKPQDNNIQY